MLHSIETIVIDWSHQIRDILSKDSAQLLLEGLHPLPRTEFDFWRTRTSNLQCINEQVTPRPGGGRHRTPTAKPTAVPLPQLLSPRVSALAEILEKADSCYWPALQAMFRDVSAGRAPGGRGLLPLASPVRVPGRPRCFSPAPGLQEADNISLYLQPLQTLLEEMEQAEYAQVGYSCWDYPGGWVQAGAQPGSASPSSDRGLHANGDPAPAAPVLHRQGPVHRLPHLGALGALQHSLPGHRHPAGDLQPPH